MSSILFVAISLSLGVVAVANEIRIGVVTDQNGINADIGRDYLAGARTYFDHINANGRRPWPENHPDRERRRRCRRQYALRLTRELIATDRVDALFGYTGDENNMRW